jgi:hypothetical protein
MLTRNEAGNGLFELQIASTSEKLEATARRVPGLMQEREEWVLELVYRESGNVFEVYDNIDALNKLLLNRKERGFRA